MSKLDVWGPIWHDLSGHRCFLNVNLCGGRHGGSSYRFAHRIVRDGFDSCEALLATQAQAAISFNLLHSACGSRLKQQYLCAAKAWSSSAPTW
jgi:hypothetical protein